MGVDVVLKQVEGRGSSPKRRRLAQVDAVLDGSDLFAHICESSNLPMLNRVDPYGTLILTPQDMPQFISEVDAERSSAEGDAERDILTAVRGLAERCADEVSMELHLEGD
ncbi:hypothetical protein [Streptomyces spinosus]|uniref:hypothetical protein n=1 Tax=Streptomyces spinosus TaxID=2872623 RepID=UPI001CED391E|nr:hypothetical protein [Streptomyces spinosus]